MPTLHLTDLTVRSLKASRGRVTYADASFPAFGIRVGQRSKTFVVVVGAARKRVTLGQYPALSLQEARQKARAYYHGLVEFDENTGGITLADAVDDFLRKHRPQNKIRTRRDTERQLRRHFIPRYGKQPLNDLTTRDITKVTDELLDRPSEAIHAHAALSVFLGWCHARQLITTNPIAPLPLPAKPRSRDRVLTDDELKAVWKAAGDMGGPFGTIVRVCIRTGLRRSEVAALQGAYIKPDRITLPGFLMKNNAEHSIPNSIADLLARTVPHGYLFPNCTGSTFNAWSKTKARLDTLSGVTGYVLHDLRRTFSTTHARIGTPPHITERLLSHKTSQSLTPLARIYNRYEYWDEQCRAMKTYLEFLAGLVGDA